MGDYRMGRASSDRLRHEVRAEGRVVFGLCTRLSRHLPGLCAFRLKLFVSWCDEILRLFLFLFPTSFLYTILYLVLVLVRVVLQLHRLHPTYAYF